MASGTSGTIARQVDRLFGEGTVAGLSEGQLLERFVSRRDEAAFEALVAQHGPMVLGLCRRIIRDRHEAEDAFQATFLLLARKARSIRSRDLVGPWLYRVAHRVALRASRSASRRIERERPDSDRASDALDPSRPPIEPDLAPALHDELARLPERYRAPLVLCDLQGLTHEEAAARLLCPIGTVKGRLSRARSRLRDRLSIRGLVAPAGAVAACLAADARAAVPSPLLDSTIKAAAPASAGRLAAGTVSATARTLAEGVAHSMLMNKLRWVGTAAMLALAFVAAGVGAVVQEGGRSPNDLGPTGPAGSTNATAAQEEPQPLADSLLGLWYAVRLKYNLGDKPGETTNPHEIITIRRDTITALLIEGDAEGGDWTLMPMSRAYSARPPDETGVGQIDIFQQRGETRETLPGIYESNSGSLKLCYRVSAGERPESFEPGPDEISLVLMRSDELPLEQTGQKPPESSRKPKARRGSDAQENSARPARQNQAEQASVGPIDVAKAAPGITEEDRDKLRRSLWTTRLNLELSEDEYTHALERVAELRRAGDRLQDQARHVVGGEQNRAEELQAANLAATQDAILELHKLVEFKQQLMDEIEDLEERLRAPSIEPRKLWPGDRLVVEALEALPGRPITGERVVRPDGTISLGFYGDIAVAGLDRKQIKTKVIAHLRHFLDDEVLGLVAANDAGEPVVIPPENSDRVYVDESLTDERQGDGVRLDDLERRLNRALSELETLRRKESK